MAERVTVKRASQLSGLSLITIRYGIEHGELDFGRAIHTSKNRTVYHIIPEKLASYLGISVEEVKEEDKEDKQ